MKRTLTVSLAGLVVLGGCAFGEDEGESNTQSDKGQTDKTQQEDNNHDQNQSNDSQSSEENKDKNDTGVSEDENDSTEDTEDTTSDKSEQTKNNEGKNNDNSNPNAKYSMDKNRAVTELKEYEEAFKKVISYSEDNGELKEYKTKDKLKEHFLHFMSAERADELINNYFIMRDGSLHVKAMDGPRFLNSDQPFEFKQGSNGNYKVIQETDNELRGHIQTTFTLTINDGGYWIIQDVTSERVD